MSRYDAEYNAHFPKAYRDGNVFRWKSNDSVPPEDIAASWMRAGFITAAEYAAMNEMRATELRALIAAERNREFSAEERYEMEAAFGRGTTVVNILTGRKIRL